MRTFGFLVLLLTVSGTAGPTAAAELEFGPFDQSNAVIDSFSGIVVVDIGDAPGIRARLDGPDDAIEKISVSERDGAVTITGPRTSGSSSVTVVGNTTVVVSGGGTAEVTIGGVDATTLETDAEPVTLTLELPRGTALSLNRFAGDATIGDTGAALTVALLGGTVDAGHVTEASLTINGSGDIRLRAASSALAMTVNGSGTIVVEDGAVRDLSGRINGSGSLRFGGRAETADVAINGAGTIDLAHVDAEPRTQMAGAGRITVGNW